MSDVGAPRGRSTGRAGPHPGGGGGPSALQLDGLGRVQPHHGAAEMRRASGARVSRETTDHRGEGGGHGPQRPAGPRPRPASRGRAAEQRPAPPRPRRPPTSSPATAPAAVRPRHQMPSRAAGRTSRPPPRRPARRRGRPPAPGRRGRARGRRRPRPRPDPEAVTPPNRRPSEVLADDAADRHHQARDVDRNAAKAPAPSSAVSRSPPRPAKMRRAARSTTESARPVRARSEA